MDVLSKEQRRKNMQAIKSKGTKAELMLAKALWSQGHRYRKNNKLVFGKPDLTFSKFKIAIFVDSEYFHGKDWEVQKHRIGTNQAFWWTKIEGNIIRDQLVTEKLKADGWQVIRFWNKDVLKRLSYCVDVVETTIKLRNDDLQLHKSGIENKC